MNDNVFNIINDIELKVEEDKNYLINDCGLTKVSLESMTNADIIRKAEIRRISKSLIKKYHKVYEALS